MNEIKKYYMVIIAINRGVTCQVHPTSDNNTPIAASEFQREGEELQKFLDAELANQQETKGITSWAKHRIHLKNTTPIKQRYQPRYPEDAGHY